jgi:hypothetical protein
MSDSQFHEDYMTINYNKKMEYHIVQSHFTDTLSKEVNALLRRGWTPLGSVRIVKDQQKELLYTQVLIKKDN